MGSGWVGRCGWVGGKKVEGWEGGEEGRTGGRREERTEPDRKTRTH